ncbi:hypothetical protein Q7P36_008626 [Cladosporium allicinum]
MEGRLLVAIEKKNHTFHVDGYSLSGTTKEEMAGLKKRRFAKLGAWELIAAYLLCKRPYIAIGTLGPTNDVEAQTMDKPKRLVKNESLTEGFVNPESLLNSTVPQALEMHSAHEASGSGRQALVVAYEFDKGRMFLFVFFIALLGLGIGVLVAVLHNDWDLDLSCTALRDKFISSLLYHRDDRRHSFLRGKAQLPPAIRRSATSPATTTFALTTHFTSSTNSTPLHSPRLTLYNSHIASHHSIVPPQHQLFGRAISTFIHTPYTPPSLNICTLHYTASIRCSLSRPPITASTPSPEPRATTSQ